LFVRKAALEGPGPAEVIAKIYKLTPTELRVLLAVVEVGGAPEVAEALWRCGDDDQVSPEGSVRKKPARVARPISSRSWQATRICPPAERPFENSTPAGT
jgi:hypothetical protein